MKIIEKDRVEIGAVMTSALRAASAVVALAVVAGCTKKNPSFCSTSMECSDGEVCDLSTHGCVSNPVDAMADSAPPECDVNKPFGPAAEVPGLRNAMANDSHATLTANELTVYFASNRFDYSTTYIYRANRPTRDATFEAPTIISSLGGVEGAFDPAISADGNTIYFVWYKPTVGPQLMTSTRSDSSSVFPMPTTLPGDSFVQPSVTADGQTLYVANEGSGLIARLQKVDGTFGAAQDVDTQLSYTQVSPATNDELTLYVTLRAGALHVTRRSSTSEAWPTPTPVTELNTQKEEWLPSWVSADGCRLYMTYAPMGTKSRIYMAARPK